jgi:hypothetical protein
MSSLTLPVYQKFAAVFRCLAPDDAKHGPPRPHTDANRFGRIVLLPRAQATPCPVVSRDVVYESWFS